MTESNLVLRGASYSARLAIPKDLREPGKPAQMWKPLGTSDLKEAKRLKNEQVAIWQDEFKAMRRRREPTADDFQRFVYDHYESEREDHEAKRASWPTQERFENEVTAIREEMQSGVTDIADIGRIADALILQNPLADDRQHRDARRNALAKHVATGETVLVHWKADQIIARECLVIEKGSRRYRDLCIGLMRAELEALKRASEFDAAEFGGVSKDPLVQPVGASRTTARAKPGEGILELFDLFRRQNDGSVRPYTWKQNRDTVALFVDYLGKNPPVTAMTRKAMAQFKQNLMLWPTRALELKEFADLNFRETIAKNATLGRPTITGKTVNRYLSAFGGFERWLLAGDYIEQPFMTNQFLTLDKTKKIVFPYTLDQLSLIAKSPIFSDRKKQRDWRFWVPLLALYGGCRLGEIGQLLTRDIREQHGIWSMHHTLDVGEHRTEKKQLKTPGSARIVPLHPRLIELGFLDFHADRVRTKTVRLFPELERDARDQFGATSKFFGAYFKRVGAKVDRSVNFHSLRHNFIDACRLGGSINEQIEILVGHAEATMTAHYGIVQQGTLQQMKTIVDTVKYGEIIFG